MRGFSTISDEERQSILSQHQTVYDGYAVGNVQGNMYPLTVGDYAQDKGGITVNNKGEVMSYQNHKINESVQELMCGECGGTMSEGECPECGYMTEMMSMENPQGNPYENEDSAYDFSTGGPEQYVSTSNDASPYDLDIEAIQNMFDYEDIYGHGDETQDSDMMNLQKKMDSEFSGKEKMDGEWDPYNFESQGGNILVDEESDEENDEFETMLDEIEEDDSNKVESLKESRNKIMEMFGRFSKFN